MSDSSRPTMSHQAVARHVGHHVVGDDLAPVAENGAGVAQRVQLFETVRDINQRAAVGAQVLAAHQQAAAIGFLLAAEDF